MYATVQFLCNLVVYIEAPQSPQYDSSSLSSTIISQQASTTPPGEYAELPLELLPGVGFAPGFNSEKERALRAACVREQGAWMVRPGHISPVGRVQGQGGDASPSVSRCLQNPRCTGVARTGEGRAEVRMRRRGGSGLVAS